MEKEDFNLNGTITIYYKNKVLIDEVQYRLLNLILTDGGLSNAPKELEIGNNKAMSLVNRMNRLSPQIIVEMRRRKDSVFMQLSDFGMKLLNSYAQKEFELYVFLKDGNRHLKNSFLQTTNKGKVLETMSA